MHATVTNSGHSYPTNRDEHPSQGRDAAYLLSTLVEFAFCMRDSMKEVNEHSFNSFKLRMGETLTQ